MNLNNRLESLTTETQVVTNLIHNGYTTNYRVCVTPQWSERDHEFSVTKRGPDLKGAVTEAVAAFNQHDLKHCSKDYDIRIQAYADDYSLGEVTMDTYVGLVRDGVIV